MIRQWAGLNATLTKLEGKYWLYMRNSRLVMCRAAPHAYLVGIHCPTLDRGREENKFKYNYPTLTNTEVFCIKTSHSTN